MPIPMPGPDLTSSPQRPVGSQLRYGARTRIVGSRDPLVGRAGEVGPSRGRPLCIRVLLCLMMPGIQHGRNQTKELGRLLNAFFDSCLKWLEMLANKDICANISDRAHKK